MKLSLWLMLTAATGAVLMGRSCGTAAGAREASMLEVRAAIDASSLQKGNDCFLVDTSITNRGQVDQEIVVWTNYAWSWVSDNPAITFDINARRNMPTRIVLKPGERHSAKLRVCHLPHHGPIRFRLGFAPRADRPASGQDNATKSGSILWSLVLTLN